MSKPLRLAIACGGTGGHIYPGIAVARAAEAQGPTEVLFIGTPDRMEARVIPHEGYPFRAITVKGFQRKLTPPNIGKNLVNLGRLGLGLPLWAAMGHLRRFRPDVVLGVGGYMSGPAILAGKLLGAQTAIIEPNALPGLTNRLLAPWVDYVAGAFPETLKGLRIGGRSEVTGTPLRPGFFAEHDTPPASLAGCDDRPIVLVTGGSLGAKRLNDAVQDLAKAIAESRSALPPLQILHVTGERFTGSTALEGPQFTGYVALPYLHDMPQVMPRAAAIVCRAGAGTLAEVAAVGVPAVLVPWPGATDNHQEHNARALERAGGAEVILDQDCTAESLEVALLRALDPKMAAKRREALRTLGNRHAAQHIAEVLRGLA